MEGSASVIFFQKSCEDVCDWITEKSEKLELEEFHHDLTTVKALQRKHKGLERELAPIKDKVGGSKIRNISFNSLSSRLARCPSLEPT